MTEEALQTRIRTILVEHAGLGSEANSLRATDDLYDAGMTSRATVNIMLAVEGTFDIEFPDEMLTRAVFESVAAIAEAVTRILAADA